MLIPHFVPLPRIKRLGLPEDAPGSSVLLGILIVSKKV